MPRRGQSRAGDGGKLSHLPSLPYREQHDVRASRQSTLEVRQLPAQGNKALRNGSLALRVP